MVVKKDGTCRTVLETGVCMPPVEHFTCALNKLISLIYFIDSRINYCCLLSSKAYISYITLVFKFHGVIFFLC